MLPIDVRPLVWPDDLEQLQRIDTAVSTDVVFDVQATPHGFALVERLIAPALQKRYLPAWDEVAMSGVALVAERADVLVGVAALTYVEWNRRALVSHLYVDRPARGQGVGTRLLRELRTRAVALNARCLWVETQNVNVPAIRFYEGHGFVFSGLDTALYDPREIAGETALFFASPCSFGVGSMAISGPLDEYHRLLFDDTDDAAAFVAALSRFVDGPAGQAFRGPGVRVEIWAEPDPDAITLYLSSDAVRATTAGFAQPPDLERCLLHDLPTRRALLLGPDDRGAYGKDDIVRRMSNVTADERER